MLGFYGQQGYQLLDKTTGTIFKSRDVIFKERTTHLVKKAVPNMNFEDDNPFQIIYLPDNAINNAKEAKTITLPHQGIATHPTISSDLRKNEANTIPDTNNHSPLQSPIVSNEIRPESKETSLNKSLAARRPQHELRPSR